MYTCIFRQQIIRVYGDDSKRKAPPLGCGDALLEIIRKQHICGLGGHKHAIFWRTHTLLCRKRTQIYNKEYVYLYYIGLGDEGSMVKGRRVNFLWVVGYPNFLWWAELQNFCGV